MSFSVNLVGVGEVEIREGNFTYYELDEAIKEDEGVVFDDGVASDSLLTIGSSESASGAFYEWEDSPDVSAKAKEIEILVRSLLDDLKAYTRTPILVRQQAA